MELTKFLVVNCLQNLLSLRSETTLPETKQVSFPLWIAYKIYYLCDRKQQDFKIVDVINSCELLTKFIIFAIGNNLLNELKRRSFVVNCLQNLLSLRSETTSMSFKLDFSGCELLTKFIIFAIGNNEAAPTNRGNEVVNCLQNLLSLRSETTRPKKTVWVGGLWIAYKIYYLCDRKQHDYETKHTCFRCELLTKFIIFAIGNNR